MATWADDIVIILRFSGLAAVNIHLDFRALSAPRLPSLERAAVTSRDPNCATFLFTYSRKNWIPQPRLWDHDLMVEKQQERRVFLYGFKKTLKNSFCECWLGVSLL